MSDSQANSHPTSAVILGAGIVGLSIALRLQVAGLRVVVLEKESSVAMHQTSRNSGVIHAGPYYLPGSLKARLCVQGNQLMKDFAEQFEIPFQTPGKILLATDRSELSRLKSIADRAKQNGVPSRLIGPDEIRDKEPFASGVGGLAVESTGIIDYSAVARRLADLIIQGGGEIILGARVKSITERGATVFVEHTQGLLTSDLLINATGLYSDHIARMAGFRPSVRIIPFRGEYFELAPDRRQLVNGLIFPVPYTRLPFLGVHLTKMISGEVHVGPNAVFAFAREGYLWKDIKMQELAASLSYPGFIKLAARQIPTGFREVYRSLNKKKFASDLARLVPGITAKDLVRVDSGVRAQAVRPDGSLVDDFVFQQTGRQLHVLNAPSPAATASLAIADYVVSEILSLGPGLPKLWFARA